MAKLTPRSISRLALPLALLALAACSPTDRQNAMVVDTQIGRDLVGLFEQITWWALGTFVVVEMALVYIIYRYRHRRGNALPRQIHGNTRLEVTWTVAPAIVLASIAVPTVQMIFRTYEQPQGADVVNITTVGHQFWWEYDYLEANVVTASDMVVPVGRQVLLKITSDDVIHSHWIPQLGIKRDAIPGHTNTVTFKPEKEGIYYGQCTEYCGAQHANMRMRVIVKSVPDYEQWLRDQAKPAATTPTSAGSALAIQKGCTGCHVIDGVAPKPAKPPVAAPSLTHFGSRTSIAGAVLDNTEENLARWLRNPQEVKPGSKMPNLNLSPQDIQTLVTYLEGLK